MKSREGWEGGLGVNTLRRRSAEMTRLHSRSGYSHIVLRKWILKLIDALKKKPHESRPDVILKAIKHYLSCPLVNEPQVFGISFRSEVAVAFRTSLKLGFPLEVKYDG
jgi:hypothetical protein